MTRQRFPWVCRQNAWTLLVLLGVFLCGCGSETLDRQSGGDDMGNFLQARLVDAAGHPVAGEVVALSDQDTVQTFSDESGVIRLAGSSRHWIRFVTQEGQYLLDSPPENGDLGDCPVGALRRVEGWLGVAGAVSIPGVGAGTRDGGAYRIDSVPPGTVRLVVDSASVVVKSQAAASVLPPLMRSVSTLQPVSVQGGGCDSACKAFYSGKGSLLPDTALSWPTVCRPWSDASGMAWNDTVHYGILCDVRDGQTYRTVDLGSQTWMAQNLGYAGRTDSVLGRCLGDDPLRCGQYGRFYDWKTAAGLDPSYKITTQPAFPDSVRRGICPAGWRLPTLTDWDVLVRAADVQDDSSWNAGLPWVDSGDGYKNIFWYLKSIQGWTSRAITRAGDDFGFRALPAGYLDASGGSQKEGSMAVFTSMTQSGKAVRVAIVAPGVIHPFATGLDIGSFLPVRCLRE
ncbi:MAG: hypothetical protein IPO40_16925 [Fibrobacteres bacterium]|nr:hypothetical protein [Fibrobacterota bacterium]